MPRTFTLVSLSIHMAVLGIVYVVQTLDGGPLPLLRGALAFADQTVTPVRLADVPLPRPAPAASPGAAPMAAPSAVTPETGRENDVAVSRSSVAAPGVEESVVPSAPIGTLPGATLPPPPPTRQQPIHLHSGIAAPRKIVGATPIYPALAQAARQEGVVILETIIDARGAVEKVHVLRGYPLLDQAAIDAVRQWRFTPALLNGQPVPVVMTVTVNFSLK
jgi:periplasmic protein TonB